MAAVFVGVSWLAAWGYGRLVKEVHYVESLSTGDSNDLVSIGRRQDLDESQQKVVTIGWLGTGVSVVLALLLGAATKRRP